MSTKAIRNSVEWTVGRGGVRRSKNEAVTNMKEVVTNMKDVGTSGQYVIMHGTQHIKLAHASLSPNSKLIKSFNVAACLRLDSNNFD